MSTTSGLYPIAALFVVAIFLPLFTRVRGMSILRVGLPIYGVLRSSGIGEVCSICYVGRRSAEETGGTS
jgi:hypothetical protein